MGSYDEVLKYFYDALPMFHRVGPAAYKPDLTNTLALCEIIGNPHKELKTVHIAGTNGKGSTSHLIASALQEAGYNVGLCTSPHLKDFRERIKINGRMITREAVVEFYERYHQSWASIEPSFFEITIALSFWYFKNEKVDIAVIETGLGGRLDSTNVILPEVCAITNIGWDHMNLLGDTLEKIAIEKAGIIKPNTPIVLGEMKPNVRSVIVQKANEHSVQWIDASLETEEPPASELKGYYQDQNRRTAYQTLLTLRKKGWSFSVDHISNGFANVIKNTGLMGRWQVLGNAPLTIADVGHNVDGIEILMKQVNDQTFENLHFVIGMVNDKDIQSVLKLLPKDAHYYFCKADIPRGLEATLLQEQALLQGLKGATYPSVRSAFEAAKEKASEKDMILVGGSVFTVAEVL
jgi:dihydrofolate synthase/folylpolyglutamate synthase